VKANLVKFTNGSEIGKMLKASSLPCQKLEGFNLFVCHVQLTTEQHGIHISSIW